MEVTTFVWSDTLLDAKSDYFKELKAKAEKGVRI